MKSYIDQILSISGERADSQIDSPPGSALPARYFVIEELMYS